MEALQYIAMSGLVIVGVTAVYVVTLATFYQSGGDDREADLLDAFEDDPIAFELHFTQQLIERLNNRAETLGEASASLNANPEPVRGRHSS